LGFELGAPALFMRDIQVIAITIGSSPSVFGI